MLLKLKKELRICGIMSGEESDLQFNLKIVRLCENKLDKV